jgi:TPR repeat protein
MTMDKRALHGCAEGTPETSRFRRGLRGTVLGTILLLVLSTVAGADYVSGKEAHDKGEFARAFKEFKPLAEKGDPRAQYYIGRMYHLGEGRVPDRWEAVRWYRKSAEQGFARAQNNLGVIYLNDGRTQDALKWFRKAAAQGMPQAIDNLKNMEYEAKHPVRGKTDQQDPAQNDPSMGTRFNRIPGGIGN